VLFGKPNLISTGSDKILEQLSDLDDISYRPMMGEFILYYHGKIVGGIYDDRLLVKKTRSALELMPAAICELPYEGAKEMLLVDKESAQNVPAPVTTYALFRDGQFLTQSIQSDKKFLALANL
jgi:TfoX/Sxy family transcriptional regulator of competence genes